MPWCPYMAGMYSDGTTTTFLDWNDYSYTHYMILSIGWKRMMIVSSHFLPQAIHFHSENLQLFKFTIRISNPPLTQCFFLPLFVLFLLWQIIGVVRINSRPDNDLQIQWTMVRNQLHRLRRQKQNAKVKLSGIIKMEYIETTQKQQNTTTTTNEWSV